MKEQHQSWPTSRTSTSQGSMSPPISPLEFAVLERLAALGGHCPSVDELFLEFNCNGSKRYQICRQLQAKGLLKFREEISRFGLTVTGKTLLKLDTSVWPVTPDQLLVLRSCIHGRISPQQIHRRVPVNQRQNLLQQLAQKRLIVVYQTAFVELELAGPLKAEQAKFRVATT
jgi:hypothetical protein